jgi:hypothetical protein
VHDAEARAERRRQQSGARRRAHERERLQRDLHRSRAGPLADHDVQLIVLHRGVEDLLDGRRQAVDFVDEEDVAFLKLAQHRREIAWFLDHGTGRRSNRHPELVRNHVRERRLAQPWRSVQEHVVERFPALGRRFDRHMQVLANTILADVVVKRAGAKPRLVLDVVVHPG